jgi:hypothetical protein
MRVKLTAVRLSTSTVRLREGLFVESYACDYSKLREHSIVVYVHEVE